MNVNATQSVSLSIARHMRAHAAEQNSAMRRLASGRRIVSAADDPAGLGMSQQMQAQLRGINRAIMNAQDAVGLLRTADAGVEAITANVNRIRDIVVMASNDAHTLQQRQIMQSEIDYLVHDIDRIVGQTRWNDMVLLDGRFAHPLPWDPPRNTVGIRGFSATGNLFDPGTEPRVVMVDGVARFVRFPQPGPPTPPTWMTPLPPAVTPPPAQPPSAPALPPVPPPDVIPERVLDLNALVAGQVGEGWRVVDVAGITVLEIIEHGAFEIVGDGTETATRIHVDAGVNADIILRDVNIVVGTDPAIPPFQRGNAMDMRGATVNLHLQGTNILDARGNNNYAGIASAGGNLTIHGTYSDRLYAYGGVWSAAIGGANRVDSQGSGNIHIAGGTIIAHAGAANSGAGAAIGSSQWGVANVRITGGHVTASAYGGAGIGGGIGQSGTVLIEGGTVIAESRGDGGGAGIGGGASAGAGIITITGGDITATARQGAGIGSGRHPGLYYVNPPSATGVYATGAGIITISGGNIRAESYAGAGIGTGWSNPFAMADITHINIDGGTVYARGTGGGAAIGTGRTAHQETHIRIRGGNITASAAAHAQFNGAVIGGGFGAFAPNIFISGGITTVNDQRNLDAPAVGHANQGLVVGPDGEGRQNITITGGLLEIQNGRLGGWGTAPSPNHSFIRFVDGNLSVRNPNENITGHITFGGSLHSAVQIQLHVFDNLTNRFLQFRPHEHVGFVMGGHGFHSIADSEGRIFVFLPFNPDPDAVASNFVRGAIIREGELFDGQISLRPDHSNIIILDNRPRMMPTLGRPITGHPLHVQIGPNAGQGMEIALGATTTRRLGLINEYREVTIDIARRPEGFNISANLHYLERVMNVLHFERARIGAYENRLTHVVSQLADQELHLAEAHSRIADADVAREVSRFVRAQMRTQAATAMFAQANNMQVSLSHLLINNLTQGGGHSVGRPV